MDELETNKPGPFAKEHTPARIGLGVAGVSLPTRSLLEFQMDHAMARDAVHDELATVSLPQELAALGLTPLMLHSAAPNREVYLRRPDLGRRLADVEVHASPCDLAVVLADGLSALAVNRHAIPLLQALLPLLGGLQLGPASVVGQGRVAIGDEIGERLGAEMVLMLIGERPGLSAPDSLGAYLTWHPRVGRTDAERNCVSNIRPEGLGYAEAATRIGTCMAAAKRLQQTGVELNRQLPSGGQTRLSIDRS